MAVRTDIDYMTQVLELASSGRGDVSPNPLVGAVIILDNKVIGEGFHAGAGQPHAEIEALRQAGSNAKGATLFVNLEPCCHTGKTGPCTEAIISAGIKKVVYALEDPDARVAGKGIGQLQKAGLEVVGDLLKDEATKLNEFYLTSKKLKRPFVILKSAQTIDGRIATATGDSKWISSDQSLEYGHALRAVVDAVVVGGETLRADNPALTVRRVKGRNPFRIVLSSTLDFPEKCEFIVNNSDNRTILASTKSAIDHFSANSSLEKMIYWETPLERGNHLNLKIFLEQAYAFGFTSILVEGGSQLATSFMKQQLVDKYICIISPKLIGQGLSSIGALEINKMKDSISFRDCEYKPSGPDMIFTGYPEWSR